ncbi:MAG: hypothetical protein VR68_00110 [Peptococcaceae bacterium BRH_c4a]|nr:MAG: hypothetical protein VR68_00110 [Peptococcaceae bacterium BRH_c4a]
MARSLPARGMTLKELMDCLRDKGLLVMCMVLTVPFLLPMSIPGSSTPFGLVIALTGLGVMLGKTPRLPGKIMNRPIAAGNLFTILDKGSGLFKKIETFTRPRLPFFTGGAMIRLNALLLVTSAILLMFPLPLPFSNTLPAYGVLFLAAGSLERDGLLILLGYLMILLTIIYFGLLAILGMAGLQLLFSRI